MCFCLAIVTSEFTTTRFNATALKIDGRNGPTSLRSLVVDTGQFGSLRPRPTIV
jgi:hypothetical protein